MPKILLFFFKLGNDMKGFDSEILENKNIFDVNIEADQRKFGPIFIRPTLHPKAEHSADMKLHVERHASSDYFRDRFLTTWIPAYSVCYCFPGNQRNNWHSHMPEKKTRLWQIHFWSFRVGKVPQTSDNKYQHNCWNHFHICLCISNFFFWM